MPLEIVSLDHVPAKFAIHVALFHNVRNAAFLQRQLLDRNAEFEYAFVDASIILSRNHILSAVFKAIIAQAQGTLETPNIHSEIVVHLSPSHNIADAYRRFGISPATTHLAVIKITFPTDTCQEPASSHVIWHHLSENVHGDALAPQDRRPRLPFPTGGARPYFHGTARPMSRIRDRLGVAVAVCPRSTGGVLSNFTLVRHARLGSSRSILKIVVQSYMNNRFHPHR
ncbi:hypothetical protein XA68_14838 [Ophiocordyceps unilateralis]|uniref:EKC/KEOPS complex subunit CGI121 n=1 Tax=Ophiocordyceps unilateralis TaxID=268505 RepID=A0A2A9PLC8_OPHUN|nr:hypothetical protein XA68_14838 [Ophiocordyceps unilateralis]